MTRRTVLRVISCIVSGFPAVPSSRAQSPAFEVASIRLNTEAPRMRFGPELWHGTLHGEKVTLRRLLAVAYGMPEPRVIGPGWLDQNRFDILAKSPQGVPDTDLKPMLQALLKDRFRLEAHLEKREMPVHYLRIAKGGSKMPVYPVRDRGPDRPGDPNSSFPMIRGTITTTQLADLLANLLDRPVIDQTRLKDRYNIFLSYAPLSPPPADRATEFGPPDIFTAIQQQLGLTLQSGKDKVEVVVIDHLDPLPTEN
jgi:uncharacterized protein (TIGR03435 family)